MNESKLVEKMRASRSAFFVSCLVACVSCLVSAYAGEVQMAQWVTLTNGWNGVYLHVAPDQTADELFANWPVKWVALYDSTAFSDTQQFDKSSDTEGTKKSGYLVWRRGDKGASTFSSIPANSILVAYATNTWSANVYGTPEAPRLTWHDSSAAGFMNFVGFSVADGFDTLTDTYFSGLDVGDAPFYVFTGLDADVPSILPATLVGKRHFKDGDVLLLDSKKTDDWSGILYVSPKDGLDFGEELNESQLQVRNDGAEARLVTLTVRRGDRRQNTGEPPSVPSFLYRDAASSLTNGPWAELAENGTVSRLLGSNETWRLDVAVDRTQLNSTSGTVWGAIFEFCDASESTVDEKNVIRFGSHFRASVPVSVTDPGEESRTYWQRGLWLAAAELDTVTFIGDGVEYGGSKDEHELPAGGKMKVRLPVYVEPDGKGGVSMTLLQRFWYGRNTNGAIRVYSGAVKKSDEPISGMKRLTSPFLPADTPVLPFTTSSLKSTAMVKFTVGEKSKVNPMRHALHPQHDGLDTYFEQETPSGDDLNNYVSTVKPESFSVTNTIEFAWDKAQETWSPKETMTGTLIWHFEGLRHRDGDQDGILRAKGKFTMKHLSSAEVKLK